MNCPNCHTANFEDAVECRNCEAPLGEVPPAPRSIWMYVAVGVGVVSVGFAFAVMQTYSSGVTCTQSPVEIADYESSLSWARDPAAENAYRDQEVRCYRNAAH